jgi:FMN phosphatase YigB (HAD superfamily)
LEHQNLVICFLDLDGCLVDFTAGVLRQFALPADTPITSWHFDRQLAARLGLSRESFWQALGEDFWRCLPWMADGRQLLTEVEGTFGVANVFLLSSPCATYGCREGKHQWVQKHLPNYVNRTFLGQAKYAFAASDKVLLDDNDDNVAQFRAAGGHAILVPRPWNQKRGYATLDYVKRSLAGLRKVVS